MSPSDSALNLKSFCTLTVLAGFAVLLLVFTVDIRADTDSGVSETLPDRLPDDPATAAADAWVGFDVLFCQSPHCERSWLTRDIPPDENGQMLCPEDWQGNPCGSELLTMSSGEKRILPGDTAITKKQYFRESDPDQTVVCSIVFSGAKRNSIHRPEVCMVGQGNTIEESRLIDVPFEGRPPLQVRVLHLKRRISPVHTRTSYYAYWFVGKERETPHHRTRLIWMALDRVFHNRMQRWAYIAVSGDRALDLEDTSHFEEIREVIQKMYPQIARADTT